MSPLFFIPLLPLCSAALVALAFKKAPIKYALLFSASASALSLALTFFLRGVAVSLPLVPGLEAFRLGLRIDAYSFFPLILCFSAGLVARGAAYASKSPHFGEALLFMDLATFAAAGFFLSDSFLGLAAFSFWLTIFSLLSTYSPSFQPRFQRSLLLLAAGDLFLLLCASVEFSLGNPFFRQPLLLSTGGLTFLLLAAVTKVAVFANPGEMDESRQPSIAHFIQLGLFPLAGAYLFARSGPLVYSAPLFPWILALGIILLLLALAIAHLEGFAQYFLEGTAIHLGKAFERFDRFWVDGAISLVGIATLFLTETLRKTQTGKIQDYFLVFAAAVTALVSAMAFYGLKL